MAQTESNSIPTACFDLHLHTHWSYDAMVPPEAYFRKARELGLRCIAISEHHVLDSLPEVLAVAEAYPDVRAIPAAELTVTASLGTFDLLCYGFPRTVPGVMQNVLDMYHEWQRAYGAALSRALQKLGCDLTDSRRLALLRTYRPAKAIDVQGNTHVRNGVLRSHLIEQGFIERESDYSAFMKRAGEAVSLPAYPNVEDVLPPVKEAGALVAIAHPYRYFRGNEIDRMDAIREECRLDGIECAHYTVPAEFTPLYREYCVRHGLVSVGGSDCHTEDEIREKFARHLGAEEWLDEFLHRIDGTAES